jgi:hypothetical protein
MNGANAGVDNIFKRCKNVVVRPLRRFEDRWVLESFSSLIYWCRLRHSHIQILEKALVGWTRENQASFDVTPSLGIPYLGVWTPR